MKLYKHKKKGTLYNFLCLAERESDGELMTVYQSIEKPYTAYVRPLSEFREKYEEQEHSQTC